MISEKKLSNKYMETGIVYVLISATKKLKSIVEKKGFVIYAAMTIKNIVTIIENLLK